MYFIPISRGGGDVVTTPENGDGASLEVWATRGHFSTSQTTQRVHRFNDPRGRAQRRSDDRVRVDVHGAEG